MSGCLYPLKPMDTISDEALNRISEIRQRRKNITDPDYWLRLNPECHITARTQPQSLIPYPISQEVMERNLGQIKKEGYFQTEPIMEPADINMLRRCISRVVGHGHNATYAFVYDEFYHVIAKLTHVLSPVLGVDFQLVPDEYAVYYIPPEDRAMGTRPHRDALRTSTSIEPDGTPTLVNVWIPLTDATTLNSCMYVLPAHLDPYYPRHDGESLVDVLSSENIEIQTNDLQNIRALPVQAGSILCWSAHLLHWGGRSSEYATHPRISFAMYFQSRRVPPYHEVTMDISAPPAFETRLHLIEKVSRRRGELPVIVS